MNNYELVAHFARIGAALFSLLMCVCLYFMRRNNRMMRTLLAAAVCTTLCYFKDIFFHFDQWQDEGISEIATSLIDLINVPMLCAFFIETAHPNAVHSRRMQLTAIVQATFVPLYMAYPLTAIVIAAHGLAIIHALVTVGITTVSSIRHQHFINARYSHTENLRTYWAAVIAAIYATMLAVYTLAMGRVTWISDLIYNAVSVTIWVFMFTYAAKHRVLRVVDEDAHGYAENSMAKGEELYVRGARQDTANAHTASHAGSTLGERLAHYFHTDKPYLSPRLTLEDFSRALGTSKRTVAEYLHYSTGDTFYDYVNGERVNEACRIIDNIKQQGHKPTMGTVATASGFYSQAAFNHCFHQFVHMSPQAYYKL